MGLGMAVAAASASQPQQVQQRPSAPQPLQGAWQQRQMQQQQQQTQYQQQQQQRQTQRNNNQQQQRPHTSQPQSAASRPWPQLQQRNQQQSHRGGFSGGGGGGGRGGGSFGGGGQFQQHSSHRSFHSGRPQSQQQPQQSYGGHSRGSGGAGGSQHHHSPPRFRKYPRMWVQAQLPPAAADAPQVDGAAASEPSKKTQKASSSVAAAAAASSSSAVVAASVRSSPPLDFKLVCYNVLCSAYVENDYFPRTPRWLLREELRRETIVQQLTGAAAAPGNSARARQQGSAKGSRSASPAAASAASHPLSGSDLIALQEVDNFDSFWLPRLTAAGYSGRLHHRTSTSSAHADGSALFWRTARFEPEPVAEEFIEFAQYPCKDRKDNVALGVMLRCKEGGDNVASASLAAAAAPAPRYLALVNTHMLYNPKRGDLKIGQMQLLMNGVDAWITRWMRQHLTQQRREQLQQTAATSQPPPPLQEPSVSLVLCGDFNALPSSTLLSFALDGQLDLDDPASFQALRSSQARAARRMERQCVDGQAEHEGSEALQSAIREVAETDNATAAAARGNAPAPSSSAAAASSSAASLLPAGATAVASSMCVVHHSHSQVGGIPITGSSMLAVESSTTLLHNDAAASAFSGSDGKAAAAVARKRRHQDTIDLTAEHSSSEESETEKPSVSSSSSAAAAATAGSDMVDSASASSSTDESPPTAAATLRSSSSSSSSSSASDSDPTVATAADLGGSPIALASAAAQATIGMLARASPSMPRGTLFPPATFLDDEGAHGPHKHSHHHHGAGARNVVGQWGGGGGRSSGGSSAMAPHVLSAFYPFHAADTPRSIHHSLSLHSAFVDKDGWRVRQRAALMRKGVCEADAIAVTIVAPRLDPLTGLPLRYRPTSHHYRFSGQVDHVLFAPQPFHFRSEAWKAPRDSPIKLCKSRVWEQEARLRETRDTQQQQLKLPASVQAEMDDMESVCSSSSAAATGAAADDCASLGEVRPSTRGGIRVTSIWDLPPYDAFLPEERTKLVQVAVKAVVGTPATATGLAAAAASPRTMSAVIAAAMEMDGAAAVATGAVPVAAAAVAPPVVSQTFVTQRQVVRVRDFGLPTPESPSDHFPLAVRFQVL